MSVLESGVVLNGLGNSLHRILTTLLPTRFLKLAIAKFGELGSIAVFVDSVEILVRFHHGFLLVLGKIVETTCDWITGNDSHLLGAGLS